MGKVAILILTKWQVVAPALPNELFIQVVMQKDVAEFQYMYLGTSDALLLWMEHRFLELGLNGTHCKEMIWIQSMPYIFLGAGHLQHGHIRLRPPAHPQGRVGQNIRQAHEAER
jgi:hypothetical protein